MKPARFRYVAATSVAHATAALAEGGAEARLIAGGQTLGPMLNLRLAMPSILIDISRVDGLGGLENTGTTCVIGACVTHAALEDSRSDSPTGVFLRYVAARIAYRAVRNRGTIGGSLAHADPAADWLSALLALDAELNIAGTAAVRQVPMQQFMRGAFTTAIGPAELLTSIRIPELSADAHWGYYRICRKVGDFPEAIGAVVLDPVRRYGRIVTGAVDGPPVVLTELAADAARAGSSAASLDGVKEAIRSVLPDMDSVDLQLHAVAVRRALLQALPHD